MKEAWTNRTLENGACVFHPFLSHLGIFWRNFYLERLNKITLKIGKLEVIWKKHLYCWLLTGLITIILPDLSWRNRGGLLLYNFDLFIFNDESFKEWKLAARHHHFLKLWQGIFITMLPTQYHEVRKKTNVRWDHPDLRPYFDCYYRKLQARRWQSLGCRLVIFSPTEFGKDGTLITDPIIPCY